jgi:hypothetical protein
MSEIMRTMIVPTALAPLARALAAGLSPGGVGMFTAGLSPTGAEPWTHYVSSGYIKPQFGGVMQDATALHAACVAAGASVTLAQCQELVSQSDVSGGDPFGAFERLGLKLVVGTL